MARTAFRAHKIARFSRDEDGSLIIFGLIMLLLMFLSAGIAIDIIRTETTRTHIQNTLDRAVLAAADLSHKQNEARIVRDYFQKAGLDHYLDDDIDVQRTKANGQTSYRRVNATAIANVPTMFMRLMDIDTIAAGGSATAEEGVTDLEISLVVDVSGSMSQTSSSGLRKIEDLEDAAKDFAFYMQCNPSATRDSGEPCTVQDGKVSISLIPYSEQVVVGSTILDQFKDPLLSSVEITDEGEGESCDPDCVAQCVTFEADDFQTSDIVAYDSDTPHYQLQRSGIFDARSSSRGYRKSSRTCRSDSWREIRPFVEDHNDIYTYLEDLRTGGNTSADIGMKWATTLLNPDMRNIILKLSNTSDGNGGFVIDSAFSNRPYSYSQEYSMKVIVLMTDGINTTEYFLKDGYRDGPSGVYRWTEDDDEDYYSVYNPSRNQYYWMSNGTWNDVPYGDGVDTKYVQNRVCGYKWVYNWRQGRYEQKYTCWYEYSYQDVDQAGTAVELSFPELWANVSTRWYKQFSWHGDPDGSNNGSEKDDRLHDICMAAKSAGIVVYTIGFEVNSHSDVVMADCATSAGHYFQANGANLAEVFGTIASSINQLRLTQ